MRTEGDDGILHLYLPRNQYWARSMLPGVARFVRTETPLAMINHSEEGLLAELTKPAQRPAGFLGLALIRDKALLKMLRGRQIPSVNISSQNPPRGMNSVIHDDHAIGQMAGMHLGQLGKRSFGYVGTVAGRLSTERLAGFREGLRQTEVAGRISVFDGQPEDLERWVEGLPLPAAVFCANDGRARAVAQRVERLGIKVPDEMAILGVDNDPFECDLTRIPLSSIELRFEELGYRAAQRVWALYCGEPLSKEPLLLEPSHVEVRLSTDYLAVEDPVVRNALRFIRQPQPGQLTVAAVAAGIGVSRRVLEKHFRQATGRTVHGEIHDFRMERALRLVEETNLPVVAISERIGLADTKRFVKLFKERYGKTPFVWRRR
jgi:LacI family transcriptional regulator